MERTTKTNQETSSRKSNEKGNRPTYKKATELKNNVNSVQILNVRKFKDYWKNDCCYFTLNLGFITIYSMKYLVDSKGNGYISFPMDEAEDGEFYARGFIDSELSDLIIDELENNHF